MKVADHQWNDQIDHKEIHTDIHIGISTEKIIQSAFPQLDRQDTNMFTKLYDEFNSSQSFTKQRCLSQIEFPLWLLFFIGF